LNRTEIKKLSYKELLNISNNDFSFDEAFRNSIFNVYDAEIKFNYDVEKEKLFNIFAFWDQIIPPTEVLDAINSWKSMGLEDSLYDDKSAKKLISDNFDKAVLQAYEKCYHPAMKSDLFRLCRLYIKGGLYVDADEKRVGCVSQVFSLMNKMKLKILFIVDEYPRKALINNKAFCAMPNYNLILNIINKIVNNIFSSKENKSNIPFITGPHAVTKIVKEEILENVDLLDEIGFMSLVAFNRVFKTVQMQYKTTDKYWKNA
jgi:mannosyltransferase OCH1-like enzyme